MNRRPFARSSPSSRRPRSAPHAEAWDRDHAFPVDTVLAMGELGLFGLPFPEDYGGSGADLTTLCIAIEELARWDQSVAITLEAAVGLGAMPIYRFGTEEQRLQPIIRFPLEFNLIVNKRGLVRGTVGDGSGCGLLLRRHPRAIGLPGIC